MGIRRRRRDEQASQDEEDLKLPHCFAGSVCLSAVEKQVGCHAGGLHLRGEDGQVKSVAI